ncbi:MAG: FHA domain-containing protein, partial [Sandaracinaceae bacterium]
MARFRLRFLLQEFDLVGPEIVLGRSPDCHITIEDPLISRRHAKIMIRGDVAAVQDLGSRNGVRINGRAIDGESEIKDGDRIRLGTQELLFSVVRRRDRPARPTGYMRVCHACATPYPEGSPTCPHCGAPALEEEDTVSGMMVESRRNWTFQLLGEVIERALSTGRAAEADRLLRRAAKEVDDRLAAGERLDADHISMISTFAVRLARLVGGSEWVAWPLTLHRRQGKMLSVEV